MIGNDKLAEALKHLGAAIRAINWNGPANDHSRYVVEAMDAALADHALDVKIGKAAALADAAKKIQHELIHADAMRKEMERRREPESTIAAIKIDIDTSSLDVAIAKMERLVALHEQAKKSIEELRNFQKGEEA